MNNLTDGFIRKWEKYSITNKLNDKNDVEDVLVDGWFGYLKNHKRIKKSSWKSNDMFKIKIEKWIQTWSKTNEFVKKENQNVKFEKAKAKAKAVHS